MRTRRWGVVAVLLVACGPQVDVIDHGEGGGEGGSEGGSEDAQADNPIAPELRGGNYPVPTLAACGQLPAGVEPIDDLATAWVVMGSRPALATELPVAPSVPRLRLGSIGIGSDADPIDGSRDPECGQIGWFFAFDLPDPPMPGVYPLAERAPSYYEEYQGFADGCGGGGTFAAANTPASAGELEIFAVTETCLMGEIRGVLPPTDDSVGVRNGGFVAQRDGVACVPIFGLECD